MVGVTGGEGSRALAVVVPGPNWVSRGKKTKTVRVFLGEPKTTKERSHYILLTYVVYVMFIYVTRKGFFFPLRLFLFQIMETRPDEGIDK